MHRAGGLCCTPLTSVAVNLQSCVKSDHGEHFVSTSGMNHLVGDGSSRILWLFPLGWSRRGLWGVEVKSDRLLQTFFGVQAVPPCPIFCFYLQPFSPVSASGLLPWVATSCRRVLSSPRLSPCRHRDSSSEGIT